MKTWILALGLVVLVGFPADLIAQSAVGIRVGMRWSDVEANPTPDGASGMVAGGYFGFGVSNRLAIQIEGVYGTRGSDGIRLGADDLDADVDPSALEMSYIEVPVLLRAGFPGKRFLPSVFLGPYVGFLLGCELTAAGEATRSCDEEVVAQRFTPRSTDYGLVAGGAFDVALGESTIFIDARYTLGLMSLESGASGFDARHTGLAISGGFAVPVGR